MRQSLWIKKKVYIEALPGTGMDLYALSIQIQNVCTVHSPEDKMLTNLNSLSQRV